MSNFKFVSRKKRAPIKKNLMNIIHEVQKNVRKKFTFRYDFVGSDKYNLVTCDFKSNVGFDFDVDVEVNDDEEHFSAKEIKEILLDAFSKVSREYGYDFTENSTRVITIKVKDKEKSKILHSCDFAIVNNYIDDNECQRQEYIHFDKKNNTYNWQSQPTSYYELPKKFRWIKNNGYLGELQKLYLDKKNNNTQNKHSYSLRAEAVHEICQKYGYSK